MIFALVLATQLAQFRVERAGELHRSRRIEITGPVAAEGGPPVVPPFFAFATPSGTGMGAPCACTTPTGTLGEVATFSRASTGFCTKSSTVDIPNGDMVNCASGQPRVMPGVDTDPSSGVLVERSHTNSLLRSSEIQNAIWIDVSTPTLNGTNTGTAPDSAVTAEDYTFAATTAGQSSGRRQVVAACTGVTCTQSCYVRGVSTSGTLDICAWGTTFDCAPCNYVNTAWRRCSVTSISGTAGGLFVGNSTANNGGVVRASNSALLWGCQSEPADYAHSYVATTSAASTVAAEQMTFSFAAAGNIVDASARAEFHLGLERIPYTFDRGASVRFFWDVATAHSGIVQDGTFYQVFNGASVGWRTVAQKFQSPDQKACVDGSCVSATHPAFADFTLAASTLYIGGHPVGVQQDAVVKNVCISTNYACTGGAF